MKNSFYGQDDNENDFPGMDAFLFSDPQDWAEDGFGRQRMDEFGGYDDPEYYENEDFEDGYEDDYE